MGDETVKMMTKKDDELTPKQRKARAAAKRAKVARKRGRGLTGRLKNRS